MYRATVLSALGPTRPIDTLDYMQGTAKHRRSAKVLSWRKAAGLFYAERLSNGRWAVMRRGHQAITETFATLAGVRGRIVIEERRPQIGEIGNAA